MKKTTLIVSFIIIIFLSFVKFYEQKKEQEKGYVIKEEIATNPEADYWSSGNDNSDSDQAAPVIIRAYICGQVKEPAVYSLREGSRVIDFVEAAGGMTDDAAKEYINLAGMVNDGDKIYIPSLTEVEDGDVSYNPLLENDSGTQNSSSVVNINTADVNALMNLPGIGESKAKAIVKYRKDHGKFQDVKDIQNVSGIGASTYSNIKDYITVK